MVPKAPAFPEDEKTTLESGWEDEASTTVEQGEVAEKIRALAGEPPRARTANGVGNITSTGNSVVDEPTVDDQRANAAIAMITPPSLAVARLVVTQGNDAGQQLEVSPGKTFTIGRAIDNDFVLTDIAVSRKHFDLRQDGIAWVLEDRRSGNGTLVNGNLEDQPFILANGDLIEIGNTTFRFEQANAPPRRPPASATPIAGRYELDEEEQSTVAGKPIRNDELATPAQMPPPPRVRPKTVPPPAPVPRQRNGAPPAAYPMGSQAQAPALGLPGLPPQLSRPAANERPKPPSQPPQPQMLVPPKSQPQPQMPGPPPSQPQPQMLRPPPSQPQPQMLPPPLAAMRPSQPQAQPATTLPMPQMPHQGRPQPMGPHGPPMLSADLGPRPSPLPTTIPGQGPPAAPSHPHLPYSYPSVSDMHKHAMLVVGNGPPRDATSTALVQPTPFGMMPSLAPAQPASAISRRTKLLLAGAALTLLAAFATIAIMKSAESEGTEQSTDGSGGGLLEGSGSAEGALAPDPVKQDPAKGEPAKTDPSKLAQGEPAKQDPEPAKQDPEPTKQDPPRPSNTRPSNTRPSNTRPSNTRPSNTRRTAIASPNKDTSAVRNRAIELYRQKKFGEAAAVLKQFAATISGTAASDLRTTASVYQQLGVAYNRGMAPAANAREAYIELQRALNLDKGSAPGEFSAEIKAKLEQIAPKAALSFLAKQDYTQALQALKRAEAAGISNADTRFVRGKLELAAKELYEAAAKEINSNPEAAKVKLKQIRGIVDSKSPTLAKANAMLSAN